jgi:hypothetical protein
MMDALYCGIDVEDYPRVMYEATRIRENDEVEHHNADTTHEEGGEQQPEEEERQQRRREGRPTGGR